MVGEPTEIKHYDPKGSPNQKTKSRLFDSSDDEQDYYDGHQAFPLGAEGGHSVCHGRVDARELRLICSARREGSAAVPEQVLP